MIVDHRHLIHACLSGLLALSDERAEPIIDRLTTDILICLEDLLIEADEDLLWLRDVMPAGHA